MGSLTDCMRKAGALLAEDVQADILSRATALRAEGMGNVEASRQAVADMLGERAARLSEIEAAMKDGVTLYEAAPETPAAAAEQQAAMSRVDQVLNDQPDLMVQLDGMDAPMRAADFMAMVKAEADEMAADAPLMQIAAECALSTGTG